MDFVLKLSGFFVCQPEIFKQMYGGVVKDFFVYSVAFCCFFSEAVECCSLEFLFSTARAVVILAFVVGGIGFVFCFVSNVLESKDFFTSNSLTHFRAVVLAGERGLLWSILLSFELVVFFRPVGLRSMLLSAKSELCRGCAHILFRENFRHLKGFGKIKLYRPDAVAYLGEDKKGEKFVFFLESDVE